MLGDTIDELRSVALAADDASGYFPAMYTRVTERVQLAVEAGRFEDGDRMIRFAETFARWYLGPRSGRVTPPACWQASWNVAGDSGLLIVQHLLLGINAHVNHDLPQVVVELADATDGDLDALRADFDAINDILGETYPDVLTDTGRVARWVTTAAGWGGGSVFNFSLSVARAQAWRAATRLQPLDADARRADVTELDQLVSVLSYLVTCPKPPLSWVVPAVRRLEQRDPRTVTSTLLGHLR